MNSGKPTAAPKESGIGMIADKIDETINRLLMKSNSLRTKLVSVLPPEQDTPQQPTSAGEAKLLCPLEDWLLKKNDSLQAIEETLAYLIDRIQL